MHKFFYILFFLFAFHTVQAQDQHYVYQDSAMLQKQNEVIADSAIFPVQDNNSQTGNGDLQQPVDTTIFYKQLSVSSDTIGNWKTSKGFEYAKYLDSLLNEKQNKKTVRSDDNVQTGPSWLDNVFASPATRIFFWTLAGIFILFILYKLFLTEGVFKKPAKNNQSATPEVSEETITGKSDFDTNINQAIRNGNYRLAIRYQYLKTLHKLADKHLIELAADKTNYQYVREISHRSYQNDFASLTLNYEYVWYGEFNIDESIYHKIAPRFSGFNQKIQPGN